MNQCTVSDFINQDVPPLCRPALQFPVTVGRLVIHTLRRDSNSHMLQPGGFRDCGTLIYCKFLKSLELHVWIESGMCVYTLEFNAPF